MDIKSNKQKRKKIIIVFVILVAVLLLIPYVRRGTFDICIANRTDQKVSICDVNGIASDRYVSPGKTIWIHGSVTGECSVSVSVMDTSGRTINIEAIGYMEKANYSIAVLRIGEEDGMLSGSVLWKKIFG